MALRTVVISDHPLIVYSLCCLVATVQGCRVVNDAASWPAFCAQVGEEAADLVILDLTTRGTPADQAPALLGAMADQGVAKVLLVADDAHADLHQSWLAAGASAVVHRLAPLAAYAEAIAAITGGQGYVHDGWSGQPVAIQGAVAAPRRPLSRCEQQVLAQLAAGRSVSEIAARQGKTVSTVSRQKRTAMHKIGAANDRELFELLSARVIEAD